MIMKIENLPYLVNRLRRIMHYSERSFDSVEPDEIYHFFETLTESLT